MDQSTAQHKSVEGKTWKGKKLNLEKIAAAVSLDKKVKKKKSSRRKHIVRPTQKQYQSFLEDNIEK